MGKPTMWAWSTEIKQKNPNRKLIGMSRRKNWVWERDGERENPRHGCGVRKARRKNHGVCFEREKQAKKHKPEANRYVPEGKVCFLEKKQAEKHMACVFREKSKQENTNRKLIGMSRREKCVF